MVLKGSIIWARQALVRRYIIVKVQLGFRDVYGFVAPSQLT